ncbi:MAG TPA: glycosyltransferase family 1 protein [Algoriphagus sp.]|jgi:glycosyltransferase involved in cell wall biosynthesis|uniref:glycosyltransferase family 4 protein n=2 Tax=Algoriphagus TaxID=246875 RepID=UPI000C44A3B6|nr:MULTISPECIES: glycosyltransferase family 4 protein [unclassified Algoriphagus]MAL11889.1 glycosyltransferase family 1 protein [Algoriphagus sp.]HAD52576.1 glycosyltransferase family 1 protein [Algoriphagus sp.]HAH35632.1 glycosyltransferase family 1 protein [Algoriphagus sp.]HCD89319.1 glycosyltransferase family 1 protein [Algoriphagus sp.]HCH45623.1 glycosyltransferase family 1 protein [Algoriphagus sp.]|tara:strand:+ start:166 stop:1332 length:1167 start_codon:yes stop_codon:yes gene_type:complete
MPKLIRITTVPLSLNLLLSGQMKYMKDKGWEVIAVSSDGKEIPQVEKREGVKHITIPFTRKITPFQDLKCVWKLYQLFRTEKPDIVHTHTPKAGLLGMIAANLAGVKIRIHTLAGIPAMAAEGQKKGLLESAEKWTYSNATEVWPNSHGLKNFVIEKELCSERKLKVIGSGSSNGVDLAKYNRSALKENHLVAATMRILPGEDDFLILAVGRLVKDKGIEELVRAFLASKIVSSSKLVLLGSFEQDLNPLSPEIIQTIQDHPRIVQIDWSDHVAHYMALADVLVHASHREGFPNVLLEAGAMQLPVICSDIIGNSDIISQQKNGLIFPVKNEEVLREALEFAFVKRDKMQLLAANLFKEISEKYERTKLHQEIFSNYQRLIEEVEKSE